MSLIERDTLQASGWQRAVDTVKSSLRHVADAVSARPFISAMGSVLDLQPLRSTDVATRVRYAMEAHREATLLNEKVVVLHRQRMELAKQLFEIRKALEKVRLESVLESAERAMQQQQANNNAIR